MSEFADSGPENRVLFLAPTRRDAATGEKILQQASLASKLCGSVLEICREIQLGSGAVILPAEALTGDQADELTELLRNQPAWSSLPVLILTTPGRRLAGSIDFLRQLGNVVLLRRPLQVIEFLNAVHTALRDRARQYQVRNHLAAETRQLAALQEADQRKDEFLAMLAHELRNPLAPIRNGLQIMKLSGGDTATTEQVREMMERQVQHMARLVDDLIDVSRISRGIAELRKEQVDLVEVVGRAIETAGPLIDARKHQLHISQPGRPLFVWADPTRMMQVIGNLVHNAAKYSEDGARIAVEVKQDGDLAVIQVRDNGVGISAEMLPKVFDLFTQVDRSLDRSQGGLGIGLTLVRRLVEMHEGSVEARSDGLGRGSEFIVRLPIYRAKPKASSPLALPETVSCQPSRILVVDDNADGGQSLTQLLRLAGHHVAFAQSGYRAIELAREFSPTIALLDIGLPGMDGYELAKQLRGIETSHRLTLIALTGYGQEEDRRRTKEAGFDHHLTKPADLKTLFAILLDGVQVRSEPEIKR